MPTEIAPHAAAPPNPVAAASPLLALLAAGSAPAYELLAAVHRLNELFVEADSHVLAVELAGALVRAPPSAAATLLRLLVDGDALVELVVQLLGNACVHPDGPAWLERAGVLPVLVAALRTQDALLRAHGLRLLSALADAPALAQPLLRAGVAKLLRGLAASPDGARPALLVADGVLRHAARLSPAQMKQLRALLDGFGDAALLAPDDAKALARARGVLRAFEARAEAG